MNIYINPLITPNTFWRYNDFKSFPLLASEEREAEEENKEIPLHTSIISDI
jgi:hypothetical protein